MNDLYTQDRMARNQDDFEGSGSGSGYYNAHDDFTYKLSEIKLPLILTVFALICVCMVLFLTFQEVSLKNNGTAATATINADRKTAIFEGEDGQLYSADLGWAYPSSDTKTIQVYYKNGNYHSAKTLTSIWIYIFAYVFFIGLLVLLIFWMFRLLHNSNHSGFSKGADKYRSKFDE